MIGDELDLVEDDHFFIVHGWIRKRLKMNKAEREIYAIIYGYSASENGYFNGSLRYLEQWTETVERTVIYSLQKLIDKKYIIKQEGYLNGRKNVKYRICEVEGVPETKLNNTRKKKLQDFYKTLLATESTSETSRVDIYNDCRGHLQQLQGTPEINEEDIHNDCRKPQNTDRTDADPISILITEDTCNDYRGHLKPVKMSSATSRDNNIEYDIKYNIDYINNPDILKTNISTSPITPKRVDAGVAPDADNYDSKSSTPDA